MKYGLVYLGGLLAVLAAGCSSDDIALEPTHATYSYEQVKDQEIALPANYNKNNYRKLLLGVAVNDIGVKAGEISPNVVQTLSTRLQTEMAKLKRFSVFSAHNRGGVLLFQSLADVGDAKMPDKNPREMDLILSASITVSKEKTERKYDDLLIYEVECDFSCEDIRTGEVKFAEKATGRTARAVKFGLGGRRVGGYSEEDEKQAIYNAAMKAIAVAANKLGNYYPVGGQITGMLSTRMTMDKGFEHGVGKDMVMTVYASVSGVDVPVARAVASPSDLTSSLKIMQWNDDDEDAEPIVDEIRKDRNWLKNNKLYAVGIGLATPPEWENQYKDSFDESMRARGCSNLLHGWECFWRGRCSARRMFRSTSAPKRSGCGRTGRPVRAARPKNSAYTSFRWSTWNWMAKSRWRRPPNLRWRRASGRSPLSSGRRYPPATASKPRSRPSMTGRRAKSSTSR